MDKRLRYELLYALAARSGREKALFGTCAPGAREAFDHSSPGRAFPEIWFEIPLSGEPRFDFHAGSRRAGAQRPFRRQSATAGPGPGSSGRMPADGLFPCFAPCFFLPGDVKSRVSKSVPAKPY